MFLRGAMARREAIRRREEVVVHWEGSRVRLPCIRITLSRMLTPLLVLVGHAKEVTSPRLRRVSISSTEENTDLEQSLASLRQVHLQSPGMFPTTVPEGEEVLPHDGPSSSIQPSPINTKHIAGTGSGKTKSLARKLASSIASLGGSPHPPLGSETGSSPVGARPETIWNSKSAYATDTQLLFKRRITNLYVQTSALKQYVELNYSGFRKILKK